MLHDEFLYDESLNSYHNHIYMHVRLEKLPLIFTACEHWVWSSCVDPQELVMRLKSRSRTLYPYMPFLPWKYASTYFPSRSTLKLFYSYTRSEHQNMFPIHFNPCYSIKLQIFLLLPLINISKKWLGCFERKKKK
jgi:hypothetical protein